MTFRDIEQANDDIERLRSVVTVRDEALRALNAYNDRLRADLEIFTASSAGLTDDVLALRAINAELLAALEAMRLRTHCASYGMGFDLSKMIEAAIAKAKGETP